MYCWSIFTTNDCVFNKTIWGFWKHCAHLWLSPFILRTFNSKFSKSCARSIVDRLWAKLWKHPIAQTNETKQVLWEIKHKVWLVCRRAVTIKSIGLSKKKAADNNYGHQHLINSSRRIGQLGCVFKKFVKPEILHVLEMTFELQKKKIFRSLEIFI